MRCSVLFFFFSSRRRHTRCSRDWSSDVCSSDLEVYYYPAERTAALDAARMAERWYARLSRILHHQFQGRKPIILYASEDRKSTRLNSSHGYISYAVFCLKKKNNAVCGSQNSTDNAA